MNTNRRYAILAVALSAIVFTATAFADAVIGSGYDSFKDAAKKTILTIDGQHSNYTAEVGFTLKFDGNIIMKEVNKEKADKANNKRESENMSMENGMREVSYKVYRDDEIEITKRDEEDTYYVYKYNDDRRYIEAEGIKEDFINDIEKIVDAAVGSLKNNIQYEDVENGRKKYTGAVSETEVPALINAVSSFAVKQNMFNGYRMNGIPVVKDNISITGAAGTATQTNDGMLDSIEAQLGFTGDDEHGVRHEITLEISFSAGDIGTTVVEKPDLTNKKVEYASSYNSKNVTGVYKNDITEQTETGLIKIGERYLEAAVENNQLNGKYYETYRDGRDGNSFDFTLTDEFFHRSFDVTDSNGEKVSLELSTNGRNILYMYPSYVADSKSSLGGRDYDGEFIRFFD